MRCWLLGGGCSDDYLEGMGMAGSSVLHGVAGSGVGAAVGVVVSRQEKAPRWQMVAVWAALIVACLLTWLVVIGGVRLVMDWATS